MECSPPHDRRPQSVDSPTPGVAPPMQRHKSIFGGGAVGNEPRIGHARRPSNPVMRRRKQFRRSLSMFENPGDIMRPKEDSPPSCAALQAVMDVEEPPQPALPHFVKEDGGDSIPRITRETLLRVLDGEFRDRYDEKMIIDCRFEYEYEGGHIMGAVNYNDKELLARKLFADGTHEQQARGDRILIIFHCEYSAHRAPMMARHIRAEDRAVNAASYPRLSYPEMYILDGGYSGFFEAHRDRCFPQNYVEMDAAEHARTCEREMGRLKRGAAGGGRKGLSRAQTYAFGQQQRSLDSHSSRAPFASLDCHQLDDSPTAPLGRGHMALHAVPAPESSPLSMLDSSPCLALDRGHTRRMASY